MLGKTDRRTFALTKPTSSTSVRSGLCPRLACENGRRPKLEYELRKKIWGGDGSNANKESKVKKHSLLSSSKEAATEKSGGKAFTMDKAMRTTYKPQEESPAFRLNIHYHAEFLDSPEWTQMCLRNKCTFVQHGDGYACQDHFSVHNCSPSSCRKTALMAQECFGPKGCPFVSLLTFQKPQLEFRGPDYLPGNPGAEPGYSSLNEMGSRNRSKTVCKEQDGLMEMREKLLKVSVPVLVALYVTLVTRTFKAHYEDSSSNSVSARTNSWMVLVSRRAKAMVDKGRTTRPTNSALRTAVRNATLHALTGFAHIFQAQTAPRFVNELMVKYNATQVNQKLWIQLVTMIIILALCLHSHVEHGPEYNRFLPKTLTILFFDKDLAPHKRWSNLSKLISRDAKQIKLLFRKRNERNSLPLPAVVTAILDDMLADTRKYVIV